MINVEGNKYIPSEEFKYLTNGTVTTGRIYLGRADSVDNWHDTNEDPEDVPIIADKAEAYDILTE